MDDEEKRIECLKIAARSPDAHTTSNVIEKAERLYRYVKGMHTG